MPEFIETLSTYIDFTPQLNGNFVSIETPPADEVNYRVVNNAAGLSIFQRGDAFRIISVGYILPGGFTHYTDGDIDMQTFTGQPCIGMIYQQSGNIIYPYELTGNWSFVPPAPVGLQKFTRSIMFVPYAGEYFLNAGSNPTKNGVIQSVGTTDFTIKMWLFQLRISMVGVPAALLDIEHKIRLYVKLAHSLPLTVQPE